MSLASTRFIYIDRQPLPLPSSRKQPHFAPPFASTRARSRVHRRSFTLCAQSRWRWEDTDIAEGDEKVSFARGVELFNRGEYYECHDVLESLWNTATEPQRTLLHAILQSCVGLYHLLNRNHRGAMVELGEGLSKLRRQRFTTGPFHQFEQEVSALLDYLYNTQLEYAACDENACVTMDGSDHSYQLLGNFGEGQQLYEVYKDNNELYVYFISQKLSNVELGSHAAAFVKVKIPVLQVTEDDLYRMA